MPNHYLVRKLCEAISCTEVIVPTRAFCKRHWEILPYHQQATIADAYADMMQQTPRSYQKLYRTKRTAVKMIAVHERSLRKGVEK